MKEVLERLKKRGLEVHYEEAYDNKETPAGRVVVKKVKDIINSIQIPLSDTEWCDLCMRDGQMYQGGCCGQTGQIQDVLNAMFRDSGVVRGDMAEALISVGASHDGYELLRGVSEEELLKAEETWDDLDPVQKIVLSVAAAAPYMKRIRTMSTSDPEDFKDVIDTLSRSSSYVTWKEMFQDAKTDKQHKGNRAVRIARMVPAARAFLLQVQKMDDLPFKGFALVTQSKQIVENMMGYAIFETQKEAQHLLDLWEETKEGKEDAKKVSIMPVEISAEYGFRIME